MKASSLKGKLILAQPTPLSYTAAYTYRTNIPDKLMQHLPKSILSCRSKDTTEFVRQLAAYIIEKAKNDFDKVKKAHDWVALNIRYDAQSYFSNNIPRQDVANILTSGLAVCQGYSNVLQSICNAMRVPCEIISGYARGYSITLFGNENPTESNHAWNKVNIDGVWYLVDCTWDAGKINNRTYKADYSTDYLFTKPEYFIYQHFPTDPLQQLLSVPVLVSDFIKLPYFKPRYFDSIKIKQKVGKTNRVHGPFVLDITPLSNVVPSFLVYADNDSNKIDNAVFVQNEDGIYKAYFSLSHVGINYKAIMFLGYPGDKTSVGCGELGFISTAVSGIRYPTQYANFGPGETIFAPIEMPLQRNLKYTFKIKTNKKYVAVIINNDFRYLKAIGNELFSLTTNIPPDARTVQIGISNWSANNYSIIAKYEVL
jgi:hypothetical protein